MSECHKFSSSCSLTLRSGLWRIVESPDRENIFGSWFWHKTIQWQYTVGPILSWIQTSWTNSESTEIKWYQTSFLSSMQEFPTKPDWFSITDCITTIITTIILESSFNLFYLSTLAIGPAMHFRPILLLHWPLLPLPLCTSEWQHRVHSDARAALTFTGAGPTDPSTSTAQRSDDCEKVFPSLFMVIKFGSTCFRSLSTC